MKTLDQLKRKITYILVLAVVITACSTKKNTFVSRSYHNLTSHYNAYFNGRESLKLGVKKVNDNFKDDYTKILPLFTYGDKTAISSATSSMDKAMKKASKVIKMHSITVKPKKKKGKKTKKYKEFLAKPEYCDWIDDSYLLLGKAYFYQHNFLQASESFEYIVTKFNKEEIKYDALLWLVRTYNERENYGKSKGVIDQLNGDKEFPEKLKSELATITADYFLKQKKYEDAILELEKAIENKCKKKVRVRCTFILAQLYQHQNELNRASELYAEVIKMNPPYEMAFNAKINRATSYDIGGKGGKEIKKQLNKMLRDDKNIEFQDQIYYALANIAMKENNKSEAIKYYKLSAQTSVSNDNQKALSFLALADIYFEKPEYPSAQAYYDSTISFLSKDFPNYKTIAAKTKNLTELVLHLNTVQEQDSLQALALMTEGERLAIIDEIIEEAIEEERRLQEELQQQQLDAMLFNQNTAPLAGGTTQGKWYFYNQTIIGQGVAEFKRKWGNRKLEDHWRRKNKEILEGQFFEEGDEEGDSLAEGTQAQLNNKKREYYLQNIPLTDSLMEVSHNMIKDALYKAGEVYKNKLNNYEKSIETLEDLNKRYPKSEYELQAYYHLYLLTSANNNQSRADYYKNLIVTNYPDSKYAKMLTNPDYLRVLEENLNKVKRFYEETFKLYSYRKYRSTLDNCAFAFENYSDDPLISKFEYLKALTVGRTASIAKFKKELTNVIGTYPESEVKEPATDMLAYLNQENIDSLMQYFRTVSAEGPIDEEFITDEQIAELEALEEETALKEYTFDEKSSYYYVIVVNKNDLDVNRIKFNLYNYNFDFFSMFEFEIRSKALDEEHHLLYVESLEDKNQAMKYFNIIRAYPDVYKEFDTSQYHDFVITPDNFKILQGDKDFNRYIEFFNQIYNE